MYAHARKQRQAGEGLPPHSHVQHPSGRRAALGREENPRRPGAGSEAGARSRVGHSFGDVAVWSEQPISETSARNETALPTSQTDAGPPMPPQPAPPPPARAPPPTADPPRPTTQS